MPRLNSKTQPSRWEINQRNNLYKPSLDWEFTDQLKYHRHCYTFCVLTHVIIKINSLKKKLKLRSYVTWSISQNVQMVKLGIQHQFFLPNKDIKFLKDKIIVLNFCVFTMSCINHELKKWLLMTDNQSIYIFRVKKQERNLYKLQHNHIKYFCLL